MARKAVWLVAPMLCASLIAGCSSGGPSQSASADDKQGKALIPVSIAQSQDILAFAPLYVARAKGFFEEEGIKLTVEILAGGSQSIQALSGGSVQFATTAAPDFLKAVLKKQDFVAVQNQIYQTQSIVVNKKFAEERGVTRDSPIEQRLKALKGALIGSTGPGASSETYPKWLVAKYAGMDPNKDIEMIGIGGLPARQAALKSGQIQAYTSSAPGPEEAEAQGFGYVLFPASQIPGAKGMIHEIVFAKREYLDKNPDVASRVARAVTRGGKFLAENPDEGKKLVAQFFPNVDQQVLSQSIDNILHQVIPTGQFSQGEWDFLVSYLKDIASLEAGDQVDTAEGGFWTNKYLK